jgi:hypothetical protein
MAEVMRATAMRTMPSASASTVERAPMRAPRPARRRGPARRRR